MTHRVDLPDARRDAGMRCFEVDLDITVESGKSSRVQRLHYAVTRFRPEHAESAARKIAESSYRVIAVDIAGVRDRHPAAIHGDGMA